MIRLLVISTLYPNNVQTRHGIFVETRLRHLMATGGVTATVIAPVPWFPFDDANHPNYVRSARIPKTEQRHGIEIVHPRYLVVPKVGMLLAPFFLFLSLLWCYLRLPKQQRQYDLIDGHYYYPDGVAIAFLAKIVRKPFTVTARGTDINLIPQFTLPKKMILWAARRASASITVCSALKQEMQALGADPAKIHVLRNGVDLELFQPKNREVCRAEFELTGKTLVSVGHLIERKGHHLVIDAMASLPDFTLVIAGDGEEFDALRNQVAALDLQDRVRFAGALSQQQLCDLYNAADALVLASSREGWANVLLESMACGTPVVATDIWGTPEVVATPAAGLLIPDRSSQAIANTVRKLFECYPNRAETRLYAEQFSWDDTVDGLVKLFSSLNKSKPQVEVVS